MTGAARIGGPVPRGAGGETREHAWESGSAESDRSGHRGGVLRSVLRARLSVPTPPDTYFPTATRGHERSLGKQGDGAQRSR